MSRRKSKDDQRGGGKREGAEAGTLLTAAMWVRHRLFPQNAVNAVSVRVSPRGKPSTQPTSTYPAAPAFDEQKEK